jgi:chorismate synthase
MRYVHAGESHGRSLTVIVSGVPAGLEVSAARIDAELARRQQGYGRGGRMSIETDRVEISSGVRFGRALGTPITLQIANRDWEHWQERMATQGEPPADLTLEHTPRPGHADLVGALKNGCGDCRDVLERASARETACRVAAGALAKTFLEEVGVQVRSYVSRIGSIELPLEFADALIDWQAVETSSLRCPDQATTKAMEAEIDRARTAGESLGGWVVLSADGLVPGLGGYASPDERLTSRIGGALFSIPAVKGVEFGLGFDAAILPGSLVHDEIAYDPARGFYRLSNNAGGLEGGMTNGEMLEVTLAMKPIPTLMTPLSTVDLVTHEVTAASKERSDVCAVPACGVVAEAELALVLADAYGRRFGDGCLEDLEASLAAYRARLARF